LPTNLRHPDAVAGGRACDPPPVAGSPNELDGCTGADVAAGVVVPHLDAAVAKLDGTDGNEEGIGVREDLLGRALVRGTNATSEMSESRPMSRRCFRAVNVSRQASWLSPIDVQIRSSVRIGDPSKSI